jgi:pyruvate-formate lyase-activating enzyme
VKKAARKQKWRPHSLAEQMKELEAIKNEKERKKQEQIEARRSRMEK